MKVVMEKYFDEYDIIQVCVIDTGIGMDKESLTKLRNLLQHLDFSEKVSEESAGCGLGLITSQLLALKLGYPGNTGIQV